MIASIEDFFNLMDGIIIEFTVNYHKIKWDQKF